MAITFPRELPNVGFIDDGLVLDEGVTASETRGRLVNFTQHTDPMWRATLKTAPLDREELSLVEGWWRSLKGGFGRVKFHPLRSPYPLSHLDDKAPAEDAGVITSVASGNILSVAGVDDALELRSGDYIGLENSSRFYLGQVVECSGSGTTRTITVEPTPFTTARQVGAVVRFAKPSALMRPVPGSFSSARNDGLWTVTFSLVECD